LDGLCVRLPGPHVVGRLLVDRMYLGLHKPVLSMRLAPNVYALLPGALPWRLRVP
jgi:hypothetical protein